MPRPVVRAATEKDIRKFYKGDNRHTVRAKVAVVRGRIIACGGVAYINGRPFAFLDLKPSARKYAVTLLRETLGVIEEFKQNGHKVIYTERNDKEPGVDRWLARIGFRPTPTPGLYAWQA